MTVYTKEINRKDELNKYYNQSLRLKIRQKTFCKALKKVSNLQEDFIEF